MSQIFYSCKEAPKPAPNSIWHPLPRVKDLEEETLFPFERQEIGEATLASTAAVAAASFLLCCTCCSLQLLQLSQQLLLQPLSQSFFIPATLLLQDKPHMESPLALQIHQQIIVASLKSVIWTRVGTTIINSDLECQGVIQLNIRLTFSATSHLSTVYQNMYFGISNWQFCILNEAAILEMWFL